MRKTFVVLAQAVVLLGCKRDPSPSEPERSVHAVATNTEATGRVASQGSAPAPNVEPTVPVTATGVAPAAPRVPADGLDCQAVGLAQADTQTRKKIELELKGLLVQPPMKGDGKAEASVETIMRGIYQPVPEAAQRCLIASQTAICMSKLGQNPTLVGMALATARDACIQPPEVPRPKPTSRLGPSPEHSEQPDASDNRAGGSRERQELSSRAPETCPPCAAGCVMPERMSRACALDISGYCRSPDSNRRFCSDFENAALAYGVDQTTGKRR